MSRRGFLARTGVAGLAVPAAVAAAPQAAAALRVQPVFVHQIKTRRQATSWRFSAEIHTEEEAIQERARIQQDLAAMKGRAEFPLEILPLVTVHEAAEAPRVTTGLDWLDGAAQITRIEESRTTPAWETREP